MHSLAVHGTGPVCVNIVEEVTLNQGCTYAHVLVMQVQQNAQRRQQQLQAIHQEKAMQLAECQQLREELQQQLQSIQQVLTQLDDKEAHLEAQFKSVAHSFEVA